MKKILLLAGFLIAGSQQLLIAQKQFVLFEGESKIVVQGTSSLHDWDMDMEKMTGRVKILDTEASIESFNDIFFEGKASELKSHSSIMDKKAHDALKADRYPGISFKMTSVQNIESVGEKFTVNITGVISVAGKSKSIVVRVTGIYKNSNSISATGSINMRMTDFGVIPPTAIMGTLKTGDEITVKFDLKFRA